MSRADSLARCASYDREPADRLTVLPFSTLDNALEALVTCLKLAVPFRTWLVARLSGDDFTILFASDQTYGITAGAVFDWSDTYCRRMSDGEGPRFAPDLEAVPAYRAAPVHAALGAGAYIGQPLLTEEGELLGTLCALDPARQMPLSPEQATMVESITRAMSTLLSVWRQADRARQMEAGLRMQAHTDALTGLSNRHAWETLLEEEEQSLAAIAENALIAVIDLDDLKLRNDRLGHAEGDRYLVRAAQALKRLCRTDDVAARLGGDEFALYLRGVPKEFGLVLEQRLRAAFDAAGIKASVGFASRLSQGSLNDALHVADMAMYKDKALRKRRKALG